MTAELELEVTKSSTCTSLADNNSPMALEPEAENEVSPPPVKKAKGLGGILFKLPTVEMSTEVSMAEKFKREVGSYLDQPYTDADSNPLLWWRSNSSIFSLLSSLARKYFLYLEQVFHQSRHLAKEASIWIHFVVV